MLQPSTIIGTASANAHISAGSYQFFVSGHGTYLEQSRVDLQAPRFVAGPPQPRHVLGRERSAVLVRQAAVLNQIGQLHGARNRQQLARAQPFVENGWAKREARHHEWIPLAVVLSLLNC